MINIINKLIPLILSVSTGILAHYCYLVTKRIKKQNEIIQSLYDRLKEQSDLHGMSAAIFIDFDNRMSKIEKHLGIESKTSVDKMWEKKNIN